MKKLLLLAALGSGLGHAAAPAWEYATFTEIRSSLDTAFFLQGEPTVKSGARSRKELAGAMKCPNETTDLDLSEAALFTCFGKLGWELVGMGSSVNSGIATKTFYFKRPVQ